MASRGRRGFGRGGRRKNWVSRQEHFWTSVRDTVVLGTNVVRFNPIVAPTDWLVRTGYSTCTLVRIRGHVAIGHSSALPGFSRVASAVIVVDADDAANFNPEAVNSYNEHDVLWTRTDFYQCPSSGTGVAWIPGLNFEIDIPVKRKLKSDDFVYFVWGNIQYAGLAAITLAPNITLRALLVPK